MVSLASLFTLQLRAADRQVLLLEPAAGSTAVKPALAPGHQQGWTDCSTAAPAPAQGQPHGTHTADRTPAPAACTPGNMQLQPSRQQILGPSSLSFGEVMVLAI